MEATIRNVREDGIEVKVWNRVGMFERTFYKVVVSLLPEYFMGTDIVSDWETFPLPGFVKQKAQNWPFEQY